MDSLDLIQTFREVAQRGSFAAAARATDMSPANVSKYIAQLEKRFGVRLFNRTTRQVSLTDAGQLLLERSGALLELIDLTADELHERATKPSGRLSVTAPHGMMLTQLPELLGNFMQRYPDVSVDLRVTNRVVDLAADGVDLAVRIGPIEDDNIIVRRLVPLDYVVAASPEYWNRHGRPSHPSELAQHAQLAYALPGDTPHWQFTVDGRTQSIALQQPRFCATDAAPLRKLAAQGLGVIWSPRLAIFEALARGDLEAALQNFSIQGMWVYAAYAQRRHNSAALRALLDFLDERLRVRDGKTPVVIELNTPPHSLAPRSSEKSGEKVAAKRTVKSTAKSAAQRGAGSSAPLAPASDAKADGAPAPGPARKAPRKKA